MAIAAPVQHAVVQHVEIWHDEAGEYALRIVGDTRVVIVRGTTTFDVENGRLTGRDRYPTAAAGWRVVDEQLAVTRTQANAALAAGGRVPRPALMTVPPRSVSTFTDVDHFGADTAALRRAVPWWVPSPGRSVAGLPLADDYVATFLSDGRSAGEEYRTGTRILTFETPPPGSPQSNARFFRTSTRRLDDDARFSGPSLIVRHGASYVTIVTQGWSPTLRQWQAIAAAARA